MTGLKTSGPWPKSLWGQVLTATAVLLILAQLLSTLMFTLLVLRPELKRVSLIMAENIAAVSKLAEDATPQERARLIHELGQSSYIEVRPGHQTPDDQGPRPRLIERVFMRQLITALGDKADLYWRTDRRHRLWMRLHIGPEVYWISVRSIPGGGPTGLVVIIGLISLGLGLALAYGLSAHLMRPLETLKGAAEGFRLSTRAPPLPEGGPREIASLSHSFNLMCDRLNKTEADRALILAGISHDLRTPLAKLRLAIDMMPDTDESLKTSAHRQVETIDRILGQFMTYARGFDAEAVSVFTLDPLIDEVIEACSDQGVIRRGPPSGLTLSGRPEAVRRALGNLIENALHYGAAPVEVSVTQTNAEACDIVIRDYGPGIPEDRLARITEPFVRGDSARGAEGGTGLGLAMVEKIAALHDGKLRLTNLADGFESRLTLRRANRT